MSAATAGCLGDCANGFGRDEDAPGKIPGHPQEAVARQQDLVNRLPRQVSACDLTHGGGQRIPPTANYHTCETSSLPEPCQLRDHTSRRPENRASVPQLVQHCHGPSRNVQRAARVIPISAFDDAVLTLSLDSGQR